MDERVRFIAAVKTGALSMVELCERFGVSRKTGYKWLSRYEAFGPAGLEERSRAPHVIPWAVSDEVAKALVDVRKAHPSWGAGKILDVLRNRGCDLDLPAASTAHEVLKRHGLVAPRKRRRKHERLHTPLAHVVEPNQGWCADFKGHFRLGNRRRCDPLTVTDAHTRFLLCCKAVTRPTTEYVKPAFEKLFREYGLPAAIRTDNGPPFASQGLAGLTQLSVWWVKLGIALERIEPGHPEQNGRHERMHKTLNEAIYPPQATVEEQQQRFDEFREEYNQLRPHDSLGGKPPASSYRPSLRPYPSELPALEYPDHHEIRIVRTDGGFKWKGGWVYCTEALIGEAIALEEVEDGRWLVRFGPLPLAILDERQKTPVLVRLPRPPS